MTLDRFIDFKNGKFVFISPTKWSDPYEKAFLKVNYHYNGKIYTHPLKPSKEKGTLLYAQCWTGSKQTEAMWRGFAPNEDGVMIKIEGQKFLNILQEISDRGNFCFYIGKVRYENTDELYQMKSERRVWEDIERGEVTLDVIRLLLKKREAFNFEDEYRILTVRKRGFSKQQIVDFRIKGLMNNLEYVKFDPRMGEKLFLFIKNALRDQFPNVNIHKSRLYSNPLKNLHYGGRRPPEENDEIVW